jgi:GTP-binding protein
MQITTLDYNDFVGQIGCGRVARGAIRAGDFLTRVTYQRNGGSPKPDSGNGVDSPTTVSAASCASERLELPCRIGKLWATRGIQRVEVEQASAGEIVWISGVDEIMIGDTLCDAERVDPLPPIEIEEPTVSMFFLVNNGPFAGNEGRPITLRQLRDRLYKETRRNVALRVEDVGRADGLKVSGRGELQLAVLIENMRREGAELCVSRPKVITRRDEADRLLEPYVVLVVDAPEQHSGAVIEKVSMRKGALNSVTNNSQGGVRLEFDMPTRGLIGYRSDFLTDTRGEGVMASRFVRYDAWAGDMVQRTRGSMIAMETGEVTSYQIENLQQRGALFVQAMDRIYEGQIVGENARPQELPCNPCKKKQISNVRSVSKEHYVKIKAYRQMTLDEALEWIADDELVEVTPGSIRVRKAILTEEGRKAAERAG